MLENLILHLVDLCCKCIRSHLVTFGEYDSEWNLALTELDEEVHVYLTDVVAGVNQDEKHHHLLRKIDVIPDYLFQLLLAGSRHLGVAISREVHQIPLSVDEEVVHKPGLTRLAGCHCKLLVAAQHVDEGRFADIGSSDESEFRKFLLRLFGYSGAAA